MPAIDEQAWFKLIPSEYYISQIFQYPEGELWHQDPLTGFVYSNARANKLTLVDERHDGDARSVWEINRLPQVLELACLYRVTRDRRYMEAAQSLLSGWLTANPPVRGINWTVAMEAALRGVNIALACAVADPEKDDPFLRAAEFALALHAQFIRRNLEVNDLGGNHLLSDLLGLYVIGTHFNSSRFGRRLLRTAWPRLLKEFGRQLSQHGVPSEGSTRYHLLVTEMIGFAVQLADQNGDHVPDDAREFVSAAASFLQSWSTASSQLVQVGDSDDGRLVRMFRAHPSQLDFNHKVGKGASEQQLEPARAQIVFGSIKPDATGRETSCARAGWVHLTAGNNHLWSRFDGAALRGRGHAHADLTSILLEVDGHPVIVDPGHPRYGDDLDARRCLIDWSAHNGLVVDDAPSAVLPYPIPSVGDIPAGLDDFRVTNDSSEALGWHDGFIDVAGRIWRFLRLGKKDLLVEDRVSGHYTGQGRTSFSIPSHYSVRLDEPGLATIMADSHLGIQVRAFSHYECWFTITEGAYYPSYGSLQRRTILSLRFVLDPAPGVIQTSWSFS